MISVPARSPCLSASVSIQSKSKRVDLRCNDTDPRHKGGNKHRAPPPSTRRYQQQKAEENIIFEREFIIFQNLKFINRAKNKYFCRIRQ